jgi:hypothetical protein
VARNSREQITQRLCDVRFADPIGAEKARDSAPSKGISPDSQSIQAGISIFPVANKYTGVA